MSSGKLQIVVACAIAMSAAAAFARADEPKGLQARADDIVRRAVEAAASERDSSSGTTVLSPAGWRASLFVSYLGTGQTVERDSIDLRPSTFVNGRLSRELTPSTRVSFDVFNVFNRKAGDIDYFATTRTWKQPGAGDNFFFNPAEPRGFRVLFTRTFK